MTPAQLALAWMLHQSPNVIPIPGTNRIARVEENAWACDIVLYTASYVMPHNLCSTVFGFVH